ncbi:GNAT family N-acetyltransferase [uncultured Pseudokineococcus sp.]|uniref:GNAT family N-acetyltransferase n=1 Tax=uncultured Pseudokineococcus sp. TaxID=1642928 RepID=UPI00262C6085|nr:GNAT family N-acetyltransferase [uncultured Pseudokineococcus sp.]
MDSDLPAELGTRRGPGRVRRAVSDDVPALVALLADDVLGATRESGDPAPHDLAPYERAFAAVDADPAHLLVVAEVDGEVAGTLQLTVLPGLSRRGALRAQVEGVRVAAAHRSSGLGSALVTWAADEARRRGCALLQLTTDARRVDAHRFYERLGFERSHVGFELPLDRGEPGRPRG